MLSTDPYVVAMSSVAIPEELAVEALGRQPELAAPAKLALTSSGETVLLAEVPLVADRALCEALARAGLERALAWLSNERAVLEGDGHEALEPGEVEEALSSLPFAWERVADGAYRIEVVHDHVPARLRVEARWPSVLHVSAESALPVRAPSVGEALRRFALETNRRLRLARLAVASNGNALASLVWDAVLPAALPLGPALGETTDALVAARAATERELRALGVEDLAHVYLSLRADRPEGKTRRNT